MLSAFTARPIVELKQRDKSKIESVLAYGDRLLVGLNTGTLRIYRVNETITEPSQNGTTSNGNPTPQPKPRAVDLLREEEKFSRRPIQQLARIKEANILVSLSDSYVSIHDQETYALAERLERTRGATCFAVTSDVVTDAETGIQSLVSRLAVAVKRKIIQWSWTDMELGTEVKEVSLMATVKSLTWATGTKIVAGMDPGYVLVDIETQKITDVNKPVSAGEAAAGQTGTRFGAVNSSGMGYMGMGSWVPKPMATRLSEGQMLLAKDVNTLFIDTDGNPLDKKQVPWIAAPEAVGYSYPYLLALSPPSRGALEVRNPDTLSLLQAISLPNATLLHVPQPYISLAHAGKGFLVASDRCIWRMGALEYEAQIDALVSSKRYDEAISLLNMLEDTLLKDKVGRLRETKMRKAHGLFEQRKYREAIDLFSEAEAPPQRVISLYPRVVAGDLSTIEEKEDEIDGDNEEPAGGSSVADSKPSASTPNRLLFGRLKGDLRRVDSDMASVRSLRFDDAASLFADGFAEGRDLLVAVNELRVFLVQAHARLLKLINTDGTLKEPLPPPDESGHDLKPPFHHLIILPENAEDIDWQKKLFEVAVMVDTTLFRAYMLASPSLAGSLFRLDNFCDPHVVEEKLYESGRYNELIDFLHGKKLHREALELLEKFGKNEAREEVSPVLRGPQRTVAYLQQLPPEMIDLILEFAEWPLRTDPKLGMEVFLADTENAETLPRDKVLHFLEQIDPKLAVRYLEHIINELNDQKSEYHQRLIDMYLERLRDENGGAFESDDERKQWLERLNNFLESSAQYNRARAFRQLPSDDPSFYESRAIVLSNMGQHKQALQIYVFQMAAYDKAEDYCNQVYLSSEGSSGGAQKPYSADAENAEQHTIYHTLLSLYLSPPPPHKPNWPPALDLLSRHGARLPASSTLDLIPPSLPVKELESYFRGRIRSANSVMNQERIVKGLAGVEKVNVDAALLLGEGEGRMGLGRKGGRNRRVVVGEDRHCAVCHKRFGASAIRVYPDNEVVHYGCFGRAGQAKGGSGWR
ncbi:hypothetical protein W97_07002 [Coniosporium apollinis CBS 100218]|uniref:CNH domain-containing protein n=1 Tax=Coniosporium apollinis (strain CBS 100218) TaxID=1168221 RepID=R7Z0Y9_CONA1|nr:uncharacterized protein W97_07002 [Coniosporium apollinis CBS 100218]EON67748.1 hypothetical protein W97_07002 [Coniosporium apollinis CBS 100218]